MKKKNVTKNALLASILAMVLCVTMLVGTTFAWFTDTASAKVNKIQSGNLDVALEYATAWDSAGNPTAWADATTLVGGLSFLRMKEDGTREQASDILWEPGCTYTLPELRISNQGSLSLKYKVVITGIDGNAELNNVIDWTAEIGGATYNLTDEHRLAAKNGDIIAADILTISGHMQETAGNDYMNKELDGISITVYATQDTAEFDSISNEYDKNADGTPDTPDWGNNSAATGTVVADQEIKLQDSSASITLTAPAGTVTAGTELTLTKKKTETPATVTIVEGRNSTSYEIKLTDAAGTAVTAAEGEYFTLTLNVPANLVVTNFLHNGVALTKKTALNAVDQYRYDAATGVITFTTDDFSPFTVEYKFNGGNGTEAAPYLIATADDWASISKETAENIYFKQIADIKVSSVVSGFSGTYDGGDHQISTTLTASGNAVYLFKDLVGNATVRNLSVQMDTVAVSLFYTANWGEAYDLTVENVTFSSTSDLIQINETNFGFVVINALYTSGSGAPTYTFKNITNNVNLQNAGTCTGVFVGSGPCFNVKTTLNYDGCVNNGKITGKESVGFLYGNSAYIESVDETESSITVNNCENTVTLTVTEPTGRCAFAPKYDTLNNQYQTACGGTYQIGDVVGNATFTVTQKNDGSAFHIESTLSGNYTYKFAMNVSATYTMKDGQAWDENDVAAIKNGTWDTVSNVSNGVKYLVENSTSDDEFESLYTFHAYDIRSAQAAGIDTAGLTFNADGYAIVVVNGVNCMIFNSDASVYIDCNVTPIVYVYSGNSIVGTKNIK